MRIFGLILIAFGLSLLIFTGYNFIKERNRILSPIPQDTGVKVILISPTGPAK